MSFYIYLASSDSLHRKSENSDNKFHDFVIEFYKEYNFETGNEWVVALTDIFIETKTTTRTTLVESCIVLSDLVIELYKFPSSPHIKIHSGCLFQPYYVSLSQTRIKRIRVYLRNTQLEDLEIDKWPKDAVLRCTLHFMKV